MPFQPGQSGNPKGRPKRGNTMTDALKRVLREKTPEGKTKRDLVAQALYEAALDGNVAAIKEINDRLDGKVEQPQQLTGANGGPIEAVVSWGQLAQEADGNE